MRCLKGKFISDIDKEINNIYEKINKSKSNTMPIVTFKRISTSKSRSKFKRLTQMLDKYCAQLLTNGMTPLLSKKINEIKNLLVVEGNAIKYMSFQGQLCKVEAAVKDTSKF